MYILITLRKVASYGQRTTESSFASLMVQNQIVRTRQEAVEFSDEESSNCEAAGMREPKWKQGRNTTYNLPIEPAHTLDGARPSNLVNMLPRIGDTRKSWKM
ncbi:uncharacterized protein SCHCODRAFT_02334750 [Schizophyllum commune H4-8]|uniref:uncharacterized protein n=1 Tax=Schizophyllum commune (strain H4-8 / FGSC 9210) TaxID=578458 RepID=UPI00215F45DD|nr:uncharacterized protein SCHCODRAFT_02334750 [Schizophyllum commune H4-8]KAI5890029.1 hypothetical protein SCHCODRAFT_02334750 [Schizophyllum commune H4-8]